MSKLDKKPRRDFLKKTFCMGCSFALFPYSSNLFAETGSESKVYYYDSDKIDTELYLEKVGNSFSGYRFSDIKQKLPLVKCEYYKKLAGNKVLCELCPNNCVIKKDKKGRCLTRINVQGELYTQAYGLTNTYLMKTNDFCHPLVFHTCEKNILNVGLIGCGLRCTFCFIGSVVQSDPEYIISEHIPPQAVIDRAVREKASFIRFTHNEPTNNYEYTLAIAKLARRKGLKTYLQTSGYVNPKPFEKLLNYINIVDVNLKCFSENGYKKYTSGSLKPILNNILTIHKKNIPFQISYLLLPTISDNRVDIHNMAIWIKENVGPYTPVYFLRYYPSFKLKNLPPTSLSSLENTNAIAKKAGLKFSNIYLGIWYGIENYFKAPEPMRTLNCPYCGEMVLQHKLEKGSPVFINNLNGPECKWCGKKLPGVTSVL